MLVGIDHGIFGFINVAGDLEGTGGVTQGPHRPMNGLGPVQLSHSGKVDAHQLGPESYGLPVERQGLPDIDDLWKPRQGVEVQGEFEAILIPGLLQELLGPDGIIAVQLFEALIPVRAPDPWPDGTVQLGMVTLYAQWLHLPTQERISQGLPIDGYIHCLPYPLVHKG